MTADTGVDTAADPVTGPAPPADPAATRQIIRPYGDTTGDGMVQLSFSLPVPAGKRAEAAALRLAGQMGLDPANVVHAKAMGPDFTFFVVYGRVHHLIDYASIPAPAEREYPLLTAGEVNLAIRTALNRRLVVVGACIGTDAHTVGIDAILNVKGFAGEKGLEYYREIQVVNMGAQVTVEELVARAAAEGADAVLVSQVVTQRNAHLHNTKQMAAAFHDAHPADASAGPSTRSSTGPSTGPSTGSSTGAAPRRPLLVVGGPRFGAVSPEDLGVDRIFGRDTTPAEVASYLVHALIPRRTQ
jgi:beta-lysine 5,6-aminomutase beta subunit